MKYNKSVTMMMGVFAITTFAITDTPVFAAGEGGMEKKSISVLEGKCGEGKCGAERVRKMMDRNSDGNIDRGEYVAWSASAASSEFDKITSGSSTASAEKVFSHFESLQQQVSEGE